MPEVLGCWATLRLGRLGLLLGFYACLFGQNPVKRLCPLCSVCIRWITSYQRCVYTYHSCVLLSPSFSLRLAQATTRLGPFDPVSSPCARPI